MAEQRGGEPPNYVARLSEWADAHLTFVRNISTGLAIAGVIVLAKSIKLTAKFTNALEIPPEFIEKNVKLRGQLRQITEQGLEIEHVPITLPIISSLQKRLAMCNWFGWERAMGSKSPVKFPWLRADFNFIQSESKHTTRC